MTTNTIYFDSHDIGHDITSEEVSSFASLGFGSFENAKGNWYALRNIPQSMLFVALSFMKEKFNVYTVCVCDCITTSFDDTEEENFRNIIVGNCKEALSWENFFSLARANYEKGANSFVECWTKVDFDQYVMEHGVITEKDAFKMFEEQYDHELDVYGYADYNISCDPDTESNSNEIAKEEIENNYDVYFVDWDGKKVIVEYFETEEDAKNFITANWGWYPSKIDNTDLMYLYHEKTIK